MYSWNISQAAGLRFNCSEIHVIYGLPQAYDQWIKAEHEGRGCIVDCHIP